jgi:Uma2 family endonuclease
MPTILHSLVQRIIMKLLERAGWNSAPEVRLKVVREAEPVPDVVGVRGKFKGRYPTEAPELCIEILSPGDTLKRALEKARTYLSWGSQSVWIIAPEQRTAWSLSREAPEPVWIAPEGALRIGDTAIELQTLFAEVDDSLESAEDL